MRDKIKQLPNALQHQLFIRAGGGIFFVFLFIVIQICFGDFYFSLPCLFCGSVVIVNGGWLLYNSLKGNYIRIQGICQQIETTGIRKRIKSVHINSEPYVLKIHVRSRIRNLSKGDTVIIYLSEKTPVYEQDGRYTIGSYYALETGKEG